VSEINDKTNIPTDEIKIKDEDSENNSFKSFTSLKSF
jgi:hypothetical protein